MGSAEKLVVGRVANCQFNMPFCSKQPLFKNSFWPESFGGLFLGLIIYIFAYFRCRNTAIKSLLNKTFS